METWYEVGDGRLFRYQCSRCNGDSIQKQKICPHCGANMKVNL